MTSIDPNHPVSMRAVFVIGVLVAACDGGETRQAGLAGAQAATAGDSVYRSLAGRAAALSESDSIALVRNIRLRRFRVGDSVAYGVFIDHQLKETDACLGMLPKGCTEERAALMYDDIVPPMSDGQLSARARLLRRMLPLLRRRDRARARAGPTRSREDVARDVLSSALSLCEIKTEGEHLVVECQEYIPSASQLAFATAIANADAVISRQARTIFFYQPGGSEFARADRVSGVRLR